MTTETEFRTYARASRLWAEVLTSAGVEYKGATLKARNGVFTMTSPLTGTHTLSVRQTPSLRLLSHWEGFCFNHNAVRNARRAEAAS